MRFAVTSFSLALLAACSFTGRGDPDGGEPIDAAIDALLIDAPIDAPQIPDHCLGPWCRRKPITIHATSVTAGPHTDFPVLVRLTLDDELAAEARADGFDIRFTAGDGVTPLAYDRAYFVSATGSFEAWVSIPALSSTTDTLIYMYFGNAAAIDQQTPTQVWAAPYRGVWHLDDAPASALIKDASGNANDGLPRNNVVLGAPGALGTAAAFDGVNDMLEMADSPSLDLASADGTFGLWIKWVDRISGEYQLVMSSTNRFKGSMDEIRVASVARSAGWIATEYANQSSTATFYTVGLAETLPP